VSAAGSGRIRPLPARIRDRAQIEDEYETRVRPQDMDALEHDKVHGMADAGSWWRRGSGD